jgi:hypothetical protein
MRSSSALIQPFRLTAGLVTLLAASACAPVAPLVIEKHIGPFDPEAPPAHHGSLVVYTEMEPFNGDPDYLVRTGYTVLTTGNAIVQQVDNRSTVPARDPALLSLPAGRYKVVASANGSGPVSLSAVIEAGRMTIIDLNEEVLPVRTTEGGNWVRLSSGQIIGAGFSE